MYYISMKVKVTVPTTLKDIKLSQYQKFLKTTKDIEDVHWNNKQLVGIFCNLSDEQVRGMDKKGYNNILAILNKTLSELESKEVEHHTVIKHNGKEYGFIPNIENITVGEQADIDSMITDWSKMDKVMSIFYRPITGKRKGKYVIEDYKEPQSLDVTMDIVRGALVFFFHLLTDLLSCTQSYIQEAVQHPKTLQTLEKNGIGIRTFRHSLEETFLGLRESLNLNYMKP